MVYFSFFWSPEGRKLATYKADNIKDARARFRKDFPSHAKYMGEVYVETS